jgi:hypothetical protein
MPALVEGDYTAKPRRLLHGETCLRGLSTGARMAIPGPRDALDMSGAGTDSDQPA